MDAKEYSEQLLSYSSRYIEDGLRVWERYLQGLSNAADGNVKLDKAQERFTDFAREDGTETIRKLVQINFDYYKSLMDICLEFSEKALNASLQGATNQDRAATARDEAANASSASKTKNIDLNFSAKKRSLQKQAFVVANKNNAETDVSFEVSELICEDGKTKTSAPVTFEPGRFTLKAGEEQVVECRLKLTKALKPGMQHVALARVVGFEDLFVRLIVGPE